MVSRANFFIVNVINVQTLFFSRLLCKDYKIKINEARILPVVQHGHDTWSRTSREERRLKVFEN